MMPVYGDMLAFFPELRRAFKTYVLPPDVVAGYQPTNEEDKIIIYGILQFVKAGSLAEEGDTLSDRDVPVFWSRTPVKNGVCIEDVEFGKIVQYRVVKPASWRLEGAFHVYVLETLVGVTTSQVQSADVKLGVDKYA